MTSLHPMSPEEAKKYHEKRAREVGRHASEGYVDLSFIMDLEGIPPGFLEKAGVLIRDRPVPAGFDRLMGYRPSIDWADRLRAGKLIPLFIEQEAAKELVERWRAHGQFEREQEAPGNSRVSPPADTHLAGLPPAAPHRVKETHSLPTQAPKEKVRLALQRRGGPAGLLLGSPIPAGVATVVSLLSFHRYLTEDSASVIYPLFAFVLLVVPGTFVLSGSKELLRDRAVTWIKFTLGAYFVWFIVLGTPMRGL